MLALGVGPGAMHDPMPLLLNVTLTNQLIITEVLYFLHLQQAYVGLH